MIRNKGLQKLSKKDLIRNIEAMEDNYLEMVRVAQLSQREAQMNFARLVAVLDSVGGEVTLSLDAYEAIDLERAKITTHPNEEQTESTFKLEVDDE